MAQSLTQSAYRPGSFILTEANGQRSRENGVVALGIGPLEAGTLMRSSEGFSLTTTGDTHTNTTLDAIADVTGLVDGRRYAISGTGIPAGTTFVKGASDTAVTLSQAATASGTGVAITITEDVAQLEVWESGDDAAGLIIYPVDATDMDVGVSYIARDAEVNLKQLVLPDGDEAEAVTAMAAIGIICRN